MTAGVDSVMASASRAGVERVNASMGGMLTSRQLGMCDTATLG